MENPTKPMATSALNVVLGHIWCSEGMFRLLTKKIDAVTMTSISWWCIYMNETPKLSEIALIIFTTYKQLFN